MSDFSYRMRRLFNPDSGRCFDIAVDHGFFGEAAFLPGIEDLGAAVRVLAAAAPDAIQMTIGQARLLQGFGGRERPALVLRTDIANIYGAPLPDHTFNLVIPEPALAGVRLDASCIVVNLFDLADNPRVREACIRAVLEAKRDCEKYNMPLMVEPLVMKHSDAGGYQINGNLEKIVPLVRQAVELGADIIKADPTDDPTDYHEVVRIANGIPVLVRGGGKVPDDELFRRTQVVLEQGAAGIVYGRNVIQHSNPARLTRALMAMLHEGADAQAASAIMAAS
ncbi:MAG: aldolase [Actinobacteria bacterium]|nr:aldolase [Actinomycetota bacterium]